MISGLLHQIQIIWHLYLKEFQVGYFHLLCHFSIMDTFRWFWVASVCRNIQLMVVFLKTSFLVLHSLYSNDFLHEVVCNIAIYAYGTALYSKCDVASDLRQQLKLASELESDLCDTKLRQESWTGLFYFNAGKTQLVLFNWSSNTSAIDAKMIVSVLQER